jgi:hypothetical protein
VLEFIPLAGDYSITESGRPPFPRQDLIELDLRKSGNAASVGIRTS